MSSTKSEADQKAKERMAVILMVRSGQITATEGAERLGMSRKTYYQWEKKALEGMLTSLLDGKTGRPKKATDPEKEGLNKEVKCLQQELAITQAKLRMMSLGMLGAEPFEEDQQPVGGGQSATPFLSRRERRQQQRKRSKKSK